MANYIGIDLGTTNSAICTFDGEKTRIWKSPEQNDVTPSAIHVDKRGRKRYGIRAYEQLSSAPEAVAALFKRFMGSNTKIRVQNCSHDGSPEEWSAELLKYLYGYLPEEIRNDEDAGIVITVPASFNEMQKDATMHAATLAQLGKVALMQEPAAAIMAVMRGRKEDGVFLIYDLGGGTLDVAVAQSVAGKVQLLAHGGIGLCGGRDIDRLIVENVIWPHLEENFALPDDCRNSSRYARLAAVAPYIAEAAKIELSAKEETVILSPPNLDIVDEDGEEIFFEIPLARGVVNELISATIEDTIAAARETIADAGLSPDEIDEIVFVGGPTNYKPLRDQVCDGLGVKPNTDVNPMTAVAEGAAVFAEAIDWSTRERLRKNPRGQLDFEGVSFNYNARTPLKRAKFVAQLRDRNLEGAEFEVVCLDTGWNSGRIALRHGSAAEAELLKKGENRFRVTVYDKAGNPVRNANWEIVVIRSAATIDSIPASHSIGIEIQDVRGARRLDYLARAGDALPKKGKTAYKAAAEIRAGQPASLKIRMWEGEIEEPIEDNRFIGCLDVTGMDFEGGVIRPGDEIICDYEILDSGAINLRVSIPAVGAMLEGGKNFYRREDAQIDFADAARRLQEESRRALARVEELQTRISDARLERAREKLLFAESLRSDNEAIERNREAEEKILQAKKLLNQARLDHLTEIRRMEFENYLEYYNENVREFARPQEASQFDALARAARKSLEDNDGNFDYYLSEMRSQGFGVLWRQDWFAASLFNNFRGRAAFFDDKETYADLMKLGEEAEARENWGLLRTIVGQLYEAQASPMRMEDDFGAVNINKA